MPSSRQSKAEEEGHELISIHETVYKCECTLLIHEEVCTCMYCTLLLISMHDELCMYAATGKNACRSVCAAADR